MVSAVRHTPWTAIDSPIASGPPSDSPMPAIRRRAPGPGPSREARTPVLAMIPVNISGPVYFAAGRLPSQARAAGLQKWLPGCKVALLAMSAPRMLGKVAEAAFLALTSCSLTYQSVYEGDVRFEHCYRLDDEQIGRAAWRERG